MYKNYIKIALRNLTRNKSNSVINVLGLSIGIAGCLLIMLWVSDELSYDNWNSKADRTYRVASEINFAGTHQSYAVSPAPLAQALVSDFPEVESAVRFRDYGSFLVKRDVQNYKEEDIVFTDSTLFDVFDLKLIAGSKSALTEPNSVVISETAALKYFNNEDALGKTLTFDDNEVYEITGIIKDMPENSHFRFDFFVSLTGGQEANNGIWVSNNFPTYYVLKKGVDHKAFEAKVFPHLLEKYIGPQIENIMGATYDEIAKSGAFIRYFYQPLREIHLHSDLVAELAPNGNIQYVWIFLSAAIFILIIAVVNFMNLTTAKSALRAKEIGLRKVMGSLKSNLISQFLCESLILTFLAFLLGLALAHISLPAYNQLANKNLSIPFSNPSFWTIALSGTFLIGLLAGSYPAFYLSGFKPIQTLTGRLSDKKGNVTLRNGLVVFQFLIAVVLIVATMGIRKQLSYIQNKKLGFDRQHVLVIDDAYALGNNKNAYKKRLSEHPSIVMSSYSSYLPVPSSRSDSPLCKSAEIREDNCVAMQNWDIDEDYIKTMGIELKEGRDFNIAMATDSQAVILNETAVKLFGLEDPVGKTIYGSADAGPDAGFASIPLKIIGVAKDFHYESLRENIRALGFMLNESSGSLSVKLTPGNPSEAIAHAERSWKELAPGQPFSYRFMDESFNNIYRTELRVGTIFSIFSGLGIFIACLGLFGLAAFATEKRTREIGIRKVLGATTFGIVSLLSKDFLKLVFLALIIAVPIAWYLMSQWLSSFAYKVNVGYSIFIFAGLSAILIALFTVSYHSIRSAIANPVDSIRNE